MRSPDSHLRLRAFSALSSLRLRLELPPVPVDEVRALVEREIGETLGVLVAWSRARGRYPSELFDEAIAFREVRGSRRVLRILELRYPVEVLRLVRERVESPARRANALELLDNTIEPSLRPVVMPFFDDAPIEEKAQKAGLEAVPEPLPFLESQLGHENPYVVALAFDVLSRAEPALAARHAIELLRGTRSGPTDPLVREAAIHAVVRADRATAAEHVAALLDDPDPVVRRVAHAAVERCRSAGGEEVPVESTIEKLLALRAAPVFAKLRSEDLAVLARIAEIETFERDATIFTEGEMGDALFVVVRGAVDIRREGRLLATLKKGEAFGEMAVLDAQPRSATATAAERTEVLRIASEDFYDSLHEQAEIAEGIIRMLSARLREANEALERERGSHVPAAEEKS
jgi:hypothetical protein